jgi:Predicted nucleotide-binding protein containing TIR-like domain
MTTSVDWSQLLNECGTPNPSVLDLVELGFKSCQAPVVLLSPDERVSLRPCLVAIAERAYQPRPNVLFEQESQLVETGGRLCSFRLVQFVPFRIYPGFT